MNEHDEVEQALRSSIGEVETNNPGSTGNLAKFATEPEPVKQPETTAQPAAQTTDAAAAQAKDNRDPATGKFVPKDTATKAVEPEKAPVIDKGEKIATPEATEPQKAGAAPGTWKPEAKAEWEKLPPTVKSEILRREADSTREIGKRVAENQQIKTQFDEIEQVIGPRRAALAATHGSVGEAVKKLFQYSDWAGQDPGGFIAHIASQTGFDLRSLFQEGAQPAPVAPEVTKLQQTMSGLERRLQSFEGQTQQQRVRSDASELDAFERETDQTGNAVHPHFVMLRDSGALGKELRLVNEEHPEWSMRQKIAEAYEAAVWRHSDTRNAVLTQQQQKSQEEAEAKQRAEAASRARKFTTGQPPSPQLVTGGSPKDDLRADISELVYAQLQGNSRL